MASCVLARTHAHARQNGSVVVVLMGTYAEPFDMAFHAWQCKSHDLSTTACLVVVPAFQGLIPSSIIFTTMASPTRPVHPMIGRWQQPESYILSHTQLATFHKKKGRGNRRERKIPMVPAGRYSPAPFSFGPTRLLHTTKSILPVKGRCEAG